ncbi:MAG TPA: DUF5009 domain-containing protein [Dysgonamonadaceae bacterium]|nr:DUF5009 domain-containing protein [Dysgonamonadaceae bacterium]
MSTNSTLKGVPVSKRLYSLDALRGFDMFWIMGAGGVFSQLAKITDSPIWEGIANQLSHPAWNGFTMYDLIFPLFLFMAGVSTPFSINSQRKRGKSRNQLLLRVIRRGLTLVVLGIVYNNGLKLLPLEEIRIPSVLGRIGLAYMFANIIYLYAGKKFQYIWFVGILLGYWLILKFTSAPGFALGDLTMEGNFASYIDRLIIPGKLHKGIHDPEGLIATIPAICTGLLGIFTGNLLRSDKFAPARKALIMAAAGLILLGVAQLWNLDFPINKNLWSSSFVLHTGGISLLFMSLFYYIIDVLGYTRWAFFFKVIGMNSILIYISGRFINWGYTTNALFEWLGQLFGEPYSVVVLGICAIIVKWMFLYLLYKKKIFLRV